MATFSLHVAQGLYTFGAWCFGQFGTPRRASGLRAGAPSELVALGNSEPRGEPWGYVPAHLRSYAHRKNQRILVLLKLRGSSPSVPDSFNEIFELHHKAKVGGGETSDVWQYIWQVRSRQAEPARQCGRIFIH